MKKLTLKPGAFKKGDALTRTQLKKVMGGTLSGCTTDSDCWYRGSSSSGPYMVWCNRTNGKCETKI